MFVRRTFRQGNSVAIVIPAAYADFLGIRPGDSLAVDMEKDHSLKIRPLAVGDWKEVQGDEHGDAVGENTS